MVKFGGQVRQHFEQISGIVDEMKHNQTRELLSLYYSDMCPTMDVRDNPSVAVTKYYALDKD